MGGRKREGRWRALADGKQKKVGRRKAISITRARSGGGSAKKRAGIWGEMERRRDQVPEQVNTQGVFYIQGGTNALYQRGDSEENRGGFLESGLKQINLDKRKAREGKLG